MSNDELRQQHEQIKGISEDVMFIRMILKRWPYGVAFLSFLCTVITLTVRVMNYDGQLVKQHEFVNYKKVDSAQISGINIKNDIQDRRLEKLETPRFTEVTQVKDKNGRHYKNVN